MSFEGDTKDDSQEYMDGLEEALRQPTKKKKYECVACETDFDDATKYWLHLRLHIDKTPFRCVCCKNGYKTKQALKAHRVTHWQHYRCPEYQCPQCPMAFRRMKHLREHIQAAHTHAKTQFCFSCNKPFHSLKALRFHRTKMLCVKRELIPTFLVSMWKPRSNWTESSAWK
jgi:uncharacterized Zn-finger protein